MKNSGSPPHHTPLFYIIKMTRKQKQQQRTKTKGSAAKQIKSKGLTVKIKVSKKGGGEMYQAIPKKKKCISNNNNVIQNLELSTGLRTGSLNSSSWWTRTDINSIKEYNISISKLAMLDTDKFLQLLKNNNKFRTNI